MKTKIRILHIDDNVHDRLLVKDALQRENDEFEVTEASNRELFEKYIAEDEFDLVLSDFNILGFDGLQVLQEVKDKRPNLPVIIVTGTGSEEIAIQAMKMGAADYVLKSVKHIQGLAPTIKTVLELKKTREERIKAEEALRLSEKKYRKLHESMIDGFAYIDINGRIKETNESFQKMLGYSSQELLQFTYLDLTPVKWHDFELKIIIPQVLSKGYSEVFEKEYIKKDGSVFPVELRTFLVKNEKGEKEGMWSIIRDITDRKKAVALLYESEERNRALINANPDQMFVISKDHVFLDYKSKKPGDTLVPPEEFIGKRIVDVLPQNISDLTGKHIDLLFKTGKDQLFEYSLMFKEERRFYESRLVKLGSDKVLALVRDISEQKITENALKYSENQFRSIWEKSKDGMRLIDEKGNILMVNEAFCQLFEKEKHELINNSFEIVYASQSKDQIFDSLIRKISKDSFDDILEKEYELWNNKKKWLQISSTIITKEDGSKQVLSIFRDITFRLQNEILHQELKIAESTTQIKQKFLADMSHEIRTPLSGIIGMTEILSGTTLDEIQKDYLDSIKVSSENLLYIINDILDLSKIEAGKMELHPANIKFEEFRNKFYGTFIGLKKEKPIKLLIESNEEFPKQIYADEKRLTQVINNLLSNAVKFTIEGSIIISFSVVQKSTDERIMLKVEVKDTGIGIKKADQEKLFAKFSQVNSVLSGAYEGSGLGLLICKELVHLMNGEINVISEEGKGSTFWFTFSAGIQNELSKETEKSKQSPEKKIQARVLVVEDTFISRKIASIMLEKIGCEVVMAENGRQALEVFEEGKFDIILMDIQMPIMDGITAAKEIRKRYKNIPVIVGLSAYAMEGDAEKYMHLGLDDYVIKPVTAEKLFELLKKWIRKQ